VREGDESRRDSEKHHPQDGEGDHAEHVDDALGPDHAA
jgi:hypothetical protein